jgi:hypothetical protein
MKSSVLHGFTEYSVGNHCCNIPYCTPTKSGEPSDKRGEKGGQSRDMSGPLYEVRKVFQTVDD